MTTTEHTVPTKSYICIALTLEKLKALIEINKIVYKKGFGPSLFPRLPRVSKSANLPV